MKICVLHRKEDSYAGAIVASAMCRSFSSSQVERRLYGELPGLPEGAVLINPGERERKLLARLLASGRKVAVFGNIEGSVSRDLGLCSGPLSQELKAHGQVEIDPALPFNATRLAVYYEADHPLGQYAAPNPRHLTRYDFTDEWNNMGYGRITVDNGNGPWSVCCRAEPNGASPVARLKTTGNEQFGLYAAMLDTPSASALWYNRQVGPVDSLEWHVVEAFFGDYRHEELSCFPYLSELPFGFEGGATMRLDCDQAISSASPLFRLYSDRGLPFSMAITTGLKMNGKDMGLLRDVASLDKGALLSHSHNHYPDWGGDYEAALNEATDSREWLEKNVPGAAPVRYAVSPFHQNPHFAVRAMADSGYEGFIGGTIKNDPEFLLGRAGRVPFVEKPIVSHSQQCMLHGDCFHRQGNSINSYKESFRNHLRAGAIFGYTDHPLSEQYQYGWTSERERIAVHEELIEFIESHQGIWWCSTNECLDFIAALNRTSVYVDEGGELNSECGRAQDGLPPLSILWKGECFEAR
ncbi:MAG: hypothetical protein V3W31_01435 [Thermodesulfobacteriota bacterium]